MYATRAGETWIRSMATRLHCERCSCASNNLELTEIISLGITTVLAINNTATDVSFADPTSTTQAGIWVELSNQWCISDVKFVFAGLMLALLRLSILVWVPEQLTLIKNSATS